MKLGSVGRGSFRSRLLEVGLLLVLVACLALVLAPRSKQNFEAESAEQNARAKALLTMGTSAAQRFGRVAPAIVGASVSAAAGAQEWEIERKLVPLEIEKVSDALLDDPDNLELRLRRVELYKSTENWSALLQDLNRVLSLQPENTEQRNSRAWVLEFLGRYDEASRDAKIIHGQNPGLDTQWDLSRVDVGAGRYAESIELCKNLIAQCEDEEAHDCGKFTYNYEGEKAELYWIRGAAKRGLGDEASARADFAKARELAPGFCMHWKVENDPGRHEGPHYSDLH